MATKYRDLIREMEEMGWYLVRVRGSHRIYRYAEKAGIVVIPGKLSDVVPAGTLASIRRQAGMQEYSVENVYRVIVRPEVEVVLEDAGPNWGAFAPAFPGVAGTGDTPEEAQRSVEEGLSLLFEEIQQDQERRAREQQRHSA